MRQAEPRDYVFVHALFTVWGVRAATIAIDLMHTGDLGIVSHLVGNTLYEIVYEQIDKSPKDAVSDVWKRIKQIYDELGITANRLTSIRWCELSDGMGEGGARGSMNSIWNSAPPYTS
eukprot:1660002-Pyramimonas_sp.AAC.1